MCPRKSQSAGFTTDRNAIKRLQVRSVGPYNFEICGEAYSDDKLREAYIHCLELLAAKDHKFLHNLSQRQVSPARKIIGREPNELFIKTPSLAEDETNYTELKGGWCVDLNLSEEQVLGRLKVACEVAGLVIDEDLILDFPVS